MENFTDRNYINIIFYVYELGLQILKKRKTIFDDKVCDGDPEKVFNLLAEEDEIFGNSYLNEFLSFWRKIKLGQHVSTDFNSLLFISKNFVQDYFLADKDISKKLDSFNQKTIEDRDEFSKVFEGTDDITPISEKIIFLDYDQTTVSKHPRKIQKRSRRKKYKIKGITIESKTHRIKNNKTKIHYNYDTNEIYTHLTQYAEAILSHRIPEEQKMCKTFKISLKNGSVQITPGTIFIKKFC
jgi:hypothetical protein